MRAWTVCEDVLVSEPIASPASTPRSCTWSAPAPTCTSPRRSSSRARRPTHDEFRDHIALAPAPGPPLPPEAALRPLRPGPPGLGRRPAPEPRLPRAPDRAAGAGLRGAAAQPRGADLLPAARPLEAALGAVAGRGPRRRPLRDRRQEPPRAGRRRLRRRHHHGPLRPRAGARRARRRGRRSGSPRPEPTDLQLLGEALRERADQPARDRPRRPRRAARPAPGRCDGDRRHRRRWSAPGMSAPATAASTSRSAPTAASPASAADLADLKRVKDEHGGTVNDVVLSVVAGALGNYLRARGHDTDGPRAAGDGPGQRPRRGGARRARQPDLGDDGAAAGLVRGPGRAAARWSPRRWAT